MSIGTSGVRGADYVSQSIPADAKAFTSIDVYYGLDESDPGELCNRMADSYRSRFRNVKCTPPLT